MTQPITLKSDKSLSGKRRSSCVQLPAAPRRAARAFRTRANAADFLLKMKTPEPELFRSGRQFAAWIGLTPKDHSTAGKVRLGVITRAGDEGLRSVLVVGATAVIQHAQRGGRPSPWLTELLKRKPPKLAAVALANKMARIAWKLMVTGEHYSAKTASAALAGAG